MSHQTENTRAAVRALLRSLHFSGVKFLRFVSLDTSGNVRAKVRPIDSLLSQQSPSLSDQVSIAAICFAGLPHYADVMIPGTGLDAKDVCKIEPDLNSLRILPYAPKTAMVMGYILNQYNNESSEYCCKAVLQRVIQEAEEKYNIAFSVGSEIEFCLIDSITKKPVDASVFANSVTLNEQEPFIEELYDQLEKQYISVELLHAESASGQMEVVLKYSSDPIVMADNIIFTRETIREVARKHGMIAHFTPKFDMAAAGNGMHLHVSTRDAATNIPNFCQGSSLSSTGGAFVEGILKHLPALMGLTLPTVNSYRRVGPGCWTGSVVGWGVEDKESGVRVCSNLATKEWDNVELKLIDHTSNIYLALAATLHAGLQGISQKLELRHSLGSKEEGSPPEPLPATVFKALDALENDESLISMLGPKLAKAFLALRRHEAERAGNMTFDEEVQEFIKRA